MAAQHEVAVKVSESFVGRDLNVLVERTASARDLNAARISSWEHGLIRQKNSTAHELTGKYLVARGEADAPDIDGLVYIRDGAQLLPGTRHRIIVEASDEYDLHARLAP